MKRPEDLIYTVDEWNLGRLRDRLFSPAGLNQLQQPDCLAGHRLQCFHDRLDYLVGFQVAPTYGVMKSGKSWP